MLFENIKVFTFKFLLHAKVLAKRLIQFIEIPILVIQHDFGSSRKSTFILLLEAYYFFFIYKTSIRTYLISRLWDKRKTEWKYYYGSPIDPYQNLRLSTNVQPNFYKILFDDKYICHQLCQYNHIPTPELYFTINDHRDMKSILPDIIKIKKEIVLKPKLGKGGNNIYFFDYTSNQFLSSDNIAFPIKTLPKSLFPAIIQEKVNQHKTLSAVSNSINTIRLLTLHTTQNESIVIFGTIRFGIGSLIDNVSSGGVAVGIQLDNGTLKGPAYGFSNKVYKKHPISKIDFNKFKIPYWNKILELGVKTQHVFNYYKILGLDIAVSPEGPKIIEINSKPDIVGIEMSGPLLKNDFVLSEFKKYCLIVHKKI